MMPIGISIYKHLCRVMSVVMTSLCGCHVALWTVPYCVMRFWSESDNKLLPKLPPQLSEPKNVIRSQAENTKHFQYEYVDIWPTATSFHRGDSHHWTFTDSKGHNSVSVPEQTIERTCVCTNVLQSGTPWKNRYCQKRMFWRRLN